MFLHLSVILFTRGGDVDRHPLGRCPTSRPPGRHPLGRHPQADPPGHTPGRNQALPRSRHPLQADTPSLGRQPWVDKSWAETPLGRHPSGRCPGEADTLPERQTSPRQLQCTVRIPLECFPAL